MHWLLVVLAGRGAIGALTAFNALRHHRLLDDGAHQLSRIVWSVGLGLWATLYLIKGI